MRRIITAVALALPMSLFCLHVSAAPALAAQPMAATGKHSPAPLVKCSTCGVEFTTINELQEHLKAHKDHKLEPIAQQSAAPLVKCSTCGVEFTALTDAGNHVKTHPGHTLVSQTGQSTIPLVRCSTCGVEFTTLQEVQKHLQEHSEHNLEP